jgi:hypothetical protein
MHVKDIDIGVNIEVLFSISDFLIHILVFVVRIKQYIDKIMKWKIKCATFN